MLYEIDQKTSNVDPSPDLTEGNLDLMSIEKVAGIVWESTELVYRF